MQKYAFNLYFKNKILLFSTSAFFIAVAGVAFDMFYKMFEFRGRVSPFEFISVMLQYMQYIPFAVYMLLSFEYFGRAKADKTEETFLSLKNANKKIFLSQLSVLTALNFAVTFVCFIIIISAFYLLGGLNAVTAAYSFVLCILDFFLLYFLAIMSGKLLSLVKQKRNAYVLLVLLLGMFFFGSAICSGFFYNTLNIDLGVIRLLFYVFSPETFVMPNELFGFSVLPYRFAIFFFWIFLFALTVYLRNNRKSDIKKSSAVVLSGFMLFNFAFSLVPQSKVLSDQAYHWETSGEADWYYFNNRKTARREKADFTVTKYDLDIDIYLNFRVTARMTVDKFDLEQYKFTLYHTYKISKITDQSGNKLDYIREHDYITVQNRTLDTREIIIYYKGDAPILFANIQAVNLWGGFAYYPKAGFHKVYDRQLRYYSIYADSQTQFDVSVHSPLTIYSNLDKIGRNRFSSKAKALTLAGGLFLKSKAINGTEYIYPYLFTSDGYLSAAEQAEASGELPKRGKVFLMTRLDYIEDHGDHIAYGTDAGTSDIEEEYKISQTDRDKYSLYAWVTMSDMYSENYDFLSHGISESFDFGLLYDCVKTVDCDTFYEEVCTYAFDNSDTRTPDEFLRDLLQKSQ